MWRTRILQTRSIHIYQCLISVLLATHVMSSVVADETAYEGVWSYRQHLVSGDYDQAQRELMVLLRGREVDQDQRWELHLDILKAYRYLKRYRNAPRILQQLSREDKQRPEIIAELIWHAYEQKQARNVEQHLIELRKHTDHVSQLYVGYFEALQAFDAKQWEDCIKISDETTRRFEQARLYRHSYTWEIERVQRHLRAMRNEAHHMWIIARFGEDYAHYRRGRFAQSRGNYEEAIDHYRKVKGPILNDASECYIGQCLYRMGHTRDAIAHWRQFIRKDERGLYRGEAMLRLGEAFLHESDLNRSALQQASDWFERSANWCVQIRNQSPNVNADSINAILQAFPVPKSRANRNDFGNFHRNHAGPATIANRLTSTWYLDALQVDAMLLHAFTQSLVGQSNKTQEILRSLIAFNDAHEGALLRLGDLPERFVADAANGSFVLPPSIMENLSREHILPIRLAAFYFMAGEHSRANRLLSQVHGRVAGRANRIDDWSVVEFLLGCVAYENGNPAMATSRFQRFETILKDAPIAPIGVLLLANVYAGERGEYHEAKQRYQHIIRSYPRTPLAPRALLSLTLTALNHGQHNDAREALASLLQDYSNSPFAAVGRTLETRLATDTRRSRSREARGRILPFRRHLIVPGHADFSLNADTLRSYDVKAYEVSYEVRVGCGLSAFWIRFNVFEPQAPPTSDSPLRFFRAPMLGLLPS